MPRPEYLAIGRITAPFGIRGEVKVEIHTAWPDRFALLDQVYVGDAQAQAVYPLELEGSRRHRGQAILKFAAIGDRTAAETLRGQWLFVRAEQAMPLAEGEFYWHEIIGLEVWAGERYVGHVVEILETAGGANDVYVVRGERGELLLPAIRQVIRRIDVAAGRMEVEIPAGLED